MISPITVSNDTASSPYSTNLSMASPFRFAQHRSQQRRSRRQFLQYDRFVYRMSAFAYRAHAIQRWYAQCRSKVPIRAAARRGFLQIETHRPG